MTGRKRKGAGSAGGSLGLAPCHLNGGYYMGKIFDVSIGLAVYLVLIFKGNTN